MATRGRRMRIVDSATLVYIAKMSNHPGPRWAKNQFHQWCQLNCLVVIWGLNSGRRLEKKIPPPVELNGLCTDGANEKSSEDRENETQKRKWEGNIPTKSVDYRIVQDRR